MEGTGLSNVFIYIKCMRRNTLKILNFRPIVKVAVFLSGDAQRLNVMCRRFGTFCYIFIGRVNRENTWILFVHKTYEDGIECSETSAHKIQTPGNRPNERIKITLISSQKSLFTFVPTVGSNSF